MGISGLIGAGFVEGTRDFREEQRLQREQQLRELAAKLDEEMRRQQLALQQQQLDMQLEDRISDRQYRAGQLARQDAEALHRNLSPGRITFEQAQTLRGSPATAPLVRELTELQARPMHPGFGSMAEPQSYTQLEPTSAQAKEAHLQTRGRELTGLFRRATDEKGRRNVAMDAAMEGINIPAHLVGATEDEELRTRLATEARADREWDRRQDVMDRNIRNRAENRPLSPTSESQIIQRLTKQWGDANKHLKELGRQVALMDVGLAAVESGERAAGDQIILVTFQKILDPPSVVRESEYMRSAAGQSLMDRVRGAYEQLTEGGAKMTVEQLKTFANFAREAAEMQTKAANLDGIRARIARTAYHYNIPEELIFDDDDTPVTPPPSGGGTVLRFDSKGNPIK